jgi:hypothetical protein
MILTCPNCDIINNCDPNYQDSLIILGDDLYQCYSCDHQFSQIDSLDRDWDKLHEGFKRDINPEVCLNWRTNHNRVLEKQFGRYGLESAFYQHFGIRHHEVDNNGLNKLKIQLERDKKLNKLL